MSMCSCCRSCWHAVKKVKGRSRTDLKWCSASQRKLMMPCTCLCWMVGTHVLTLALSPGPRFQSFYGNSPSFAVTSWRANLQKRLTLLYNSSALRLSRLHFSLSPLPPTGFDGNIDSQGELILQESFQVWDPKTLIRKGRDRHLFLFEMSLVFSKEVKDSNGRSKYLYKSKLFVSHVLPHLACVSSLFLSATATEPNLKPTGGLVLMLTVWMANSDLMSTSEFICFYRLIFFFFVRFNLL